MYEPLATQHNEPNSDEPPQAGAGVIGTFGSFGLDIRNDGDGVEADLDLPMHVEDDRQFRGALDELTATPAHLKVIFEAALKREALQPLLRALAQAIIVAGVLSAPMFCFGSAAVFFDTLSCQL